MTRVLAVLAALACSTVQASEPLWSLLKGGNLVLVSHGSTISALTGISPATGEMVIVTPQGDGKFTVAGRLGVD